jgi:transcriptional regulator with XRE-family HTH domain
MDTRGKRTRPVQRHPRGASSTLAKELPAEAMRCLKSREKRSMTTTDLARAARVSNTSISLIENGKLRDEIDEAGDLPRAERTWAFILMKLAIALGDAKPADWLADANLNLPDDIVRRLWDKARKQIEEVGRRTDSAGRIEPGTLGWVRSKLREREKGDVEVDVELLLSDEESRGQAVFYERIATLLLKTINPRLRVRMVQRPARFHDVMTDLSPQADGPPRVRLVVGAFKMVGRSEHRVTFQPIPGWRIRMAALALPDSMFTWEMLRTNAAGLPPMVRNRLEVHCIEGEAGDVCLRTLSDIRPQDLVVLPEYNLRLAAKAFHRALDDNPYSVFVIGEYEAAIMRAILRDEYNRKVVDVAEDSPRYQVSIATYENDERWARTLGNAMDELFKNAGGVMAEIYGHYMVEVILQAIALEDARKRGKKSLPVLRRILRLDPPDSADAERSLYGVPSYLQLHDLDFRASHAFERTLRLVLKTKLEEQDLFTGDEAEFEPYFHALAPWLRTGEQEILHQLHELKSLIRRLAKSPPRASASYSS